MDFSKIFGAAHAMEIPFVTGTMKLLGIERFMFNDENLPDAIRLSIAMQSYWAEFAYTGDPDRGRDNNLPKWNSWSSSGEKFLILDSQNDQGIVMSDFELRRILAELQAEAARTTTFPLSLYSLLSSLSINETPVALPSSLVVTVLTIELTYKSICPPDF